MDNKKEDSLVYPTLKEALLRSQNSSFYRLDIFLDVGKEHMLDIQTVFTGESLINISPETLNYLNTTTISIDILNSPVFSMSRSVYFKMNGVNILFKKKLMGTTAIYGKFVTLYQNSSFILENCEVQGDIDGDFLGGEEVNVLGLSGIYFTNLTLGANSNIIMVKSVKILNIKLIKLSSCVSSMDGAIFNVNSVERAIIKEISLNKCNISRTLIVSKFTIVELSTLYVTASTIRESLVLLSNSLPGSRAFATEINLLGNFIYSDVFVFDMISFLNVSVVLLFNNIAVNYHANFKANAVEFLYMQNMTFSNEILQCVFEIIDSVFVHVGYITFSFIQKICEFPLENIKNQPIFSLAKGNPASVILRKFSFIHNRFSFDSNFFKFISALGEESLFLLDNLLFLNNTISNPNHGSANAASYIYFSSHNVQVLLLNVTFYKNNFTDAFGGLLITEKEVSAIVFQGFKMEMNFFLGGISALKLNGALNTIIKSSFISNEGCLSIEFRGQNLYLISSNFTQNTELGTSVLYAPTNTEYFFNKLFFYNLRVGLNKGKEACIIVEELNDLLIISINSTFFENQSNLKGGVFKVFFQGLTDKFFLYFFGCLFENNFSPLGGVFHMNTLKALWIFQSCSFWQNGAEKGGVFSIFSEKTCLLYTYRCEFARNKAQTQAATIYDAIGNYEDYYSVFDSNEAIIGGCWIIGSYSEVRLNGTVIRNSFSKRNYNMVFLGQVLANIYAITVQNCRAYLRNSVISVFNYVKLNVFGSKFINNSARTATILLSSNTYRILNMVECIFIENKAHETNFIFKGAFFNIYYSIFAKNSGRIFALSEASFNATNLYLASHVCDNLQLNCIFEIKSNTEALIQDVNINEIKGGNNSGIFQVINSKLRIFRLFANTLNIFLLSFFNIKNSDFFLENTLASPFEKKFIYSTFSKLTLDNLHLKQEDSSEKSSSAVLSYNSNITISNCLFHSFSDSALLLNLLTLEPRPFICHVENSSFVNNTGINGGAISSFDHQLTISNSVFESNKAFSFGGAIYFDCSNSIGFKQSEFCSGTVNFSSIFIENEALLGGGAFYWKGVRLEEGDTVIFRGNTAEYGENLGSDVFTIILENKDEVMPSLENFVSGELLTVRMKFSFKDFYNQTAKSLPDTICKISIASPNTSNNSFITGSISGEVIPTVIGKSSALAEKGEFFFDNLKAIAKPSTKHVFLITSDLLPKFSLSLPINFGLCRVGQILNPVTSTCDYCKVGSYTFEAGGPICERCPDNADCLGKGVMRIHQGYWRHSNLSKNILKCPNPDACAGGIDSDYCEVGYTGNLCNVCKGSSEGEVEGIENPAKEVNQAYFMDIDNKCKSCDSVDRIRSTVIVSFLFLISFSYTVLMVRERLVSTGKANIKSTLLKLFTDYIQITGFIFNMNVDWPLKLKFLFTWQLNLGNPENFILPFDCYLKNDFQGSDLNSYFKRLIVLTITVFVVPVLLILFWTFTSKVFKKISHIRMKIKISLIITFYTFQPFLVEFYFSGLSCFKIDNQYYMKRHMLENCWVGNHFNITLFLILPMLIILMFIIPVYLLLQLKKHILVHGKPKEYSFLTEGYRKEFFFWDFYLMFHKYLMILNKTFVASVVNETMSSWVLLKLCFLFLFIQIQSNPYENSIINKASLLSRFALQVSIIYIVVKSDNSLLYLTDGVFGSIFALINMYFIIQFLKLYFSMTRGFMKILQYIFPCVSAFKYFIDSDSGRPIEFHVKPANPSRVIMTYFRKAKIC